MRPGKASRDRKAETRPAAAVEAGESLECTVDEVGGDPWAVLDHPYLDVTVGCGDHDVDPRSCMAPAVVEEIPEDLPDAVGVDAETRAGERRGFHGNDKPRRLYPGLFRLLLAQAGKVAWLMLEGLTAIEPGQPQQGVHEA